MASAFAALVSIENNLQLIQNHPCHSFSFEDKQIQSLCQSVRFLIEFMKSYDNSHGPRKEAAEVLERRIARAAEAAEDVIESHVVDEIRGGKTRSKTRSSRFLLDLQKVIQNMEYMRRKAVNVKAQSGVELAAAAAPLTSNNTATTTMVGSDGVLLQLLHQLTRVPSSRRVIIPIVGMGGIGKTTLATHAFRHPLTVHHFDVCLWAIISQQHNVMKILTQLLCLINESTSGTVDELGYQLHRSLYGRRYLIVLDDMWSAEAWDDINMYFPETNNGSRILVTTRHRNVAGLLSVSWLTMRFLEKEQSWDLFCQKAFGDKDCPIELEEIGKKIVEKCKGLPLPIVVVGGHLNKSTMALEYWENVSSHINSILYSTQEEHCLSVLSLSYSYLPVHLKPCFLLLGAFPEDGIIYEGDVVKLWIAEGFLEPSEHTGLEVVAECYLQDLFERNLISVHEVGFNGRIVKFKLHDLVRELCLKIAKKEDFLYVLDSAHAIQRERRVVISGKTPEVKHRRESFDAPIRCLICEGDRLSYDFKALRTLNKVVALSACSTFFQQLNLRYLNIDLDYTTRQTLYLPSSISLIWNLQVLRISVPTRSTVIAPYEIWEMLQLRHLEICPIRLIDPLPAEQSDQANVLVLRNLHTLWNAKNLKLSEEVCKRIPNIRRLVLSYCDEDCDEAASYYCPHNLCRLDKLEFLVCEFDPTTCWRQFALSLTFPSSLKWLCLSGCGVHFEELTMIVGSLPHLISLQLYPHSVIGSEWTPVEGKFLSLKNLEVRGFHDLVSWRAESFHFPLLTNLILASLPKLDEFPSGIGEIPTLGRIELEFCSESSSISAMRILVEQEEQGNEGLRLHVSLRGDEETLESFRNKVQEEGLKSNRLFLDLKTVEPKSF